jgi:hypothetical protein
MFKERVRCTSSVKRFIFDEISLPRPKAVASGLRNQSAGMVGKARKSVLDIISNEKFAGRTGD